MRETDRWILDTEMLLGMEKIECRPDITEEEQWGVRAKGEKDRAMMMTSGGGATQGAITSKALHVLPALSFERRLMTATPFVPACNNPPHTTPLPADSQGCSEMMGDTSSSLTLDQPITTDYGTSRHRAAVMRSLGFG